MFIFEAHLNKHIHFLKKYSFSALGATFPLPHSITRGTSVAAHTSKAGSDCLEAHRAELSAAGWNRPQATDNWALAKSHPPQPLRMARRGDARAKDLHPHRMHVLRCDRATQQNHGHVARHNASMPHRCAGRLRSPHPQVGVSDGDNNNHGRGAWGQYTCRVKANGSIW